jgi:hypothetical protein
MIVILVMSDEEISLPIELDSPYGDGTHMDDITSEYLCDNTAESPLGLWILMTGDIVCPISIEGKFSIFLGIVLYGCPHLLCIALREK